MIIHVCTVPVTTKQSPRRHGLFGFRATIELSCFGDSFVRVLFAPPIGLPPILFKHPASQPWRLLLAGLLSSVFHLFSSWQQQQQWQWQQWQQF